MLVIVPACRRPVLWQQRRFRLQGPTDSGAGVSKEFSCRTIPVTRGAWHEEKRPDLCFLPAQYEHISWFATADLGSKLVPNATP